MSEALSELSRLLLGHADASLLDLRLDRLAGRVSDDEAREQLTAMHAAGEGERLRDVLAEGRLVRWVEQTCNLREEQALCGQLRAWLGMGEAGEDDPRRLVRIDPPPAFGAPLLDWLDRQGLLREAMRPAREVLPEAITLELGAEATWLDACRAPEGRGRSPRLGSDADPDRMARRKLHELATERASLKTRRELHARALPSGSLGLLARRLKVLCSAFELELLHALRFVPARPVSLDATSGVCSGALFDGVTGSPSGVSLHLSGYEHRGIEGRCDACSEPRCRHVAALAARLLDACLEPSDRLHETLLAFSGRPSWQRFVQALAPVRTSGAQAGQTLRFVLRTTPDKLWVGVFVQRDDATGGRSKLVSPRKLLRASWPSDRDQSVLSTLGAGPHTLSPQFMPADVAVLRALVEHPSVIMEASGANVAVTEQALRIDMVEQPEGLLPRITLAGDELGAAAGTRASGYVIKHDARRDQLVFAPLTPALSRLLSALEHFHGVLPPESFPQLAPFLSSLGKVASVELPARLHGLERPAPSRLLLRLEPRLDEGIDLSLTVRALPLSPLWAPGQGPELVHGLVDGVPSCVRRDLALERELAKKVAAQLTLDRTLTLSAFSYRVETHQEALELLSQAARLSDVLELEWAERARPLRISASARVSDLKISLFKRGELCALSGGVQLGEVRVAIDRLLDAARTGQRFVPIGGHDYLEIERELFERLEQAQLAAMQQVGRTTLPSAAVPAWLDALKGSVEAGDEDSARWFEAIRKRDDGADLALEPGLAAQLRDYQRVGARFLLQRSQWAQGACLADEMGLGKTVQAICVLAARATEGPSLVIAPTSVVDGWKREIERFAPSLKVSVHRGEGRRLRLGELGAGSVLLMSYDLLVRDRQALDDLSFGTLILDEAQVIKNARTLRSRAVVSLRAAFRIVLTGTPIENRLGDLWSLFHVIAPGLLGSWARFRARFAVPIERYQNEERSRVLKALVSPFMLRRTKREVASELPARTEIVRLVELSGPEQDLYSAALQHAQKAVGKRHKHRGEHTVQILAELTRLRQLACHPRLVLQDSRVSSSKLKVLESLLADVLPRGHRVLVFSQFVKHLDLIREALDRAHISHLALEGSTRPSERPLLIERFQRGEAQVFLISLKAGGTGLNLTAADYVVHMDPWWNPSAEDQASDRAHRIGQDKPVTVVKLVSQGTIEERVLGLHDHKRKLAESVLAGSATDGPLDADMLDALLAELPQAG